jgi:hypothetical protein
VKRFSDRVKRWRTGEERRLKEHGAIRFPGGIWVTPPHGPIAHQPSIGLFATHGSLLIQPIATMKIGFQTPGRKVERLPDSVSDEVLGHAIRTGLADSAALAIVDEINRSRPEIRAAGLKTQREFVDGARYVSIEVRDGAIVATPSRNESPRKPRGGFAFISPSHASASGSDESIGAAARKALADCTFATPVRRRQKRPGHTTTDNEASR